jgi:hypothetical protein
MNRHKSWVKASIYGFLAGTLLSSAYVLFGRWDWFYVPEPLWARIVFFPGVAAGHLVHDGGWHSILACQIIGVGTMGIVTGMIGCGVGILINRWIRREADDDLDAIGT